MLGAVKIAVSSALLKEARVIALRIKMKISVKINSTIKKICGYIFGGKRNTPGIINYKLTLCRSSANKHITRKCILYQYFSCCEAHSPSSLRPYLGHHDRDGAPVQDFLEWEVLCVPSKYDWDGAVLHGLE